MNEQEMQGKEEMNKFMMLHNYIDKYQEKLGLTGIAKKKTHADKVLAFINKCTRRALYFLILGSGGSALGMISVGCSLSATGTFLGPLKSHHSEVSIRHA